MADSSKHYEQSAAHDDDVKTLHSMGYAQELSRRMGAFQNFAISFSIICILAGGITAFPLSLSAAGGASVGYGWPLACLFALLVAAAMGQIASAYPTAGGIYHWASLLGGRGYGWVAAWFNLLGLLFVVSSVNFGVFLLFRDLFLGEVMGLDIKALGWVTEAPLDRGWWTQTIFIAAITITQAWLNHVGIRATTILTDFSGYLIFVAAVLLTLGLVFYAPSLDFSRLFTFSNFSGEAGGSVWPTAIQSLPFIFLLGLLQGVYTVTGFDASAHTAEETRDAARSAPRGMIHSVFWSFLFGYVMLCAFILAMPSIEEGAKQGWNAFPWLMQQSPMPKIFKDILIIAIVIANYICALAGLTSTSRMMFAFSRDGGLPFSRALKHVSRKHRTPVNAIWWGAILSIIATLYGDAFVVLSTGCAVFLYISYILPIAAGLRAEINGKWTAKGPFQLGAASKLVSVLAIIGCALLIFVGVQPPNEKVGYLIVGLLVAMAIFWIAMESRRFQGPPIGDMIAKRQAEIAAAEKAVGVA
ncbi:MAG: amino acid permease [Burkholderiales bacterium]|nr:amino acid permease [Burkholderiales bacterium]